MPDSQISELLEVQRSVGSLLFQHVRHVVREDKSLTLATVPILKILHEKGPLSQHAIAAELYHSDAAVSRQIGILEARGHVYVRHDANNRRLSIVELTDSGMLMIARIHRHIEEHLAEIIRELPPDEIKALISYNQRLMVALEKTCKKENA